MDTSLSKELRAMGQKLMDRASRETQGGSGWATED
jgi:hypothetical protein